MTAPANIDAFVRLVALGGLLPGEELRPYIRNLESSGLVSTPVALAHQMVADGVLTRFHAEQLLAGKYRGFRLGKYQLLERIGAGGMGSVFLAVHQSLKRRVAIKILPPNSAANPGVLERFYRESRAAALLDHPNIARAYDADCDGNLHFLVMEYVDGIDFQQLVGRRGPLEPAHAAAYICQATEGLHHAHERRLVHRDIKPGNLMLNRQGVVKVLDMGLARFFEDDKDSLTMDMQTDAVLGTADYISPEQALHSHNVDIRADIYSLGGTLFFMLTGRPPFTGGGAAQKLLWHQIRPVENVRDIRAEVPEGLATVVARMLAKDPGQRYQTPAEVSELLAEFAAVHISPLPASELPQRCRAAEAGGGSIPAEALLFAEQSQHAAETLRPQQAPITMISQPLRAVVPEIESEENDTDSGDVLARPVGPLTILVAVACLLIAGFLIWWFSSETVAPVVPKDIPMEGEHLRILNRSSNFPLAPQQMAVFKDGKWSGNAQLWAAPLRVGEWADLILPVTVKGKYRLFVHLTKAADYGMVQFSVDGQAMGPSFDGFVANSVVNAEPLDLGVLELKKHSVTLRVTVVGTNEKSIGVRYMWGIDRLELKPEP